MSDSNGDATGGSGTRPGLLVGGVIVVLAVAFWLSSRGPDEPKAPSDPASPSATAVPGAARASASAPAGAMRPERMIESGEQLRLLASELAPGESLEVGLSLPIRHDSEEPLDARLIAQGREPYETRAVLTGSGGDFARLELPPEWLVPGTYLIEIKVREKTHLPIRRYALIVE